MITILTLQRSPIQTFELHSNYIWSEQDIQIDLSRSLGINMVPFERKALMYKCGSYLCVTYCYINRAISNIQSLQQQGVYPVYSKYVNCKSWPYGATPEIYIHMDGCNRFMKAHDTTANMGMLPQMLMAMLNAYGSEVDKSAIAHNIEFHELLLDAEFTPNLALLTNVLNYLYKVANTDFELGYVETIRRGPDAIMDAVEQISFDWGSSAISPLWEVGRIGSRFPEIGAEFTQMRYQDVSDDIGIVPTHYDVSDYILYDNIMVQPCSDFGFSIINNMLDNTKECLMYDVFTDINMLKILNNSTLSSITMSINAWAFEKFNGTVLSVIKSRNEFITFEILTADGFQVYYTLDLMLLTLLSPALLDMNKIWPNNDFAWRQ